MGATAMNEFIRLQQSPRRSTSEAKNKTSIIRIIKFIAPKVITVNRYPSPCECTAAITCAYCVQASLLGFEKKIKASDVTVNNILSSIKRNGIRKTARVLSIDHSSIRYWFKSKNIPQWAIKKYAGLGE